MLEYRRYSQMWLLVKLTLIKLLVMLFSFCSCCWQCSNIFFFFFVLKTKKRHTHNNRQYMAELLIYFWKIRIRKLKIESNRNVCLFFCYIQIKIVCPRNVEMCKSFPAWCVKHLLIVWNFWNIQIPLPGRYSKNNSDIILINIIEY